MKSPVTGEDARGLLARCNFGPPELQDDVEYIAKAIVSEVTYPEVNGFAAPDDLQVGSLGFHTSHTGELTTYQWFKECGYYWIPTPADARAGNGKLVRMLYTAVQKSPSNPEGALPDEVIREWALVSAVVETDEDWVGEGWQGLDPGIYPIDPDPELPLS